jgi:hypothetical protein
MLANLLGGGSRRPKVFATRGVCQVVSLTLAMSSSVRFPWISISPALFDLCELVVGWVDVGGAQVFLDALQLAGAGDGHDEVVLVQRPRQRKGLRGRARVRRDLAA